LARQVAGWLTALGLPPEDMLKLLKSEIPIAALCDISQLRPTLSVEFKQQLLAELDGRPPADEPFDLPPRRTSHPQEARGGPQVSA